MSSRSRIACWVCTAMAFAAPGTVLAQFPQGFDGGAGLPADWISVNASPGGPGGLPNWQQTNAPPFPSHGGTGYAFSSFNATTGANPLSNYMMSPVVTLENGAIIRFWTRCPGSTFPDRLILTYSTNGASQAVTDFGNHPANVDFHKLVDINPTLAQGGYPVVWTQFTATLSGLPGPTQGRFAFWHYIQTNSGPAGLNGDHVGVDDVEFIPPGVTTGACCDGAGNCTVTTPAGCTGPGNTHFGIGSNCAAVSCVGRCCQPDGFCANLAPDQCTGAGFTFGGLGTTCSAAGECLGRCCLPDGGCIDDGPAPCAANGGTFGAVGDLCQGNESLCVGRCCVGNACTPDQNPNQCTQAGGTLTLGEDCVVTTDFNFAMNIAIPDGVGGGGEGAPLVNVQNVSGVTGNITDLNLGVRINHTWVGDLRVTLEHLGTSVMVIDLMGHAALDCAGCDQEDINVILDDEGTGGPIEDQCNVNGLAAASPPKFTPANLLSAFDTLNPNGTWTLRVTDGCGIDTGTLLGWSLHFANPALSPCAPQCICKGDLNGSNTVNGADINKFAQCVAAPASPGCACADVNGGGITAADITPFVNALLAGTACIP